MFACVSDEVGTQGQTFGRRSQSALAKSFYLWPDRHLAAALAFLGKFFMATRRNLVAIVDDDLDLREALGQMLEMSGYDVELYASGEAFLSAAATSEAVCLVLDVQLGDITGVELSRQLAANGFEFPTVFISGSTQAAFQRAAMDLGCVAYLRKPFLTQQLIDAIVAASGSVPRCEGPQGNT